MIAMQNFDDASKLLLDLLDKVDWTKYPEHMEDARKLSVLTEELRMLKQEANDDGLLNSKINDVFESGVKIMNKLANEIMEGESEH